MYKRLLVPVDLDDTASIEKALPAAKALASGADAEIHVISVVPTAGMAVVASYLSEDFMDKAIDGAKTARGQSTRRSCAPLTFWSVMELS